MVYYIHCFYLRLFYSSCKIIRKLFSSTMYHFRTMWVILKTNLLLFLTLMQIIVNFKNIYGISFINGILLYSALIHNASEKLYTWEFWDIIKSKKREVFETVVKREGGGGKHSIRKKSLSLLFLYLVVCL